MSPKDGKSLKRIIWITALLALVFLYSAIYLLPSLKEINHLRRETREFSLMSEDLQKLKIAIDFPDKKEQKYFSQVKRQLKNQLPVVKDETELNALYGAISGYIQQTAGRDRVGDIEMKLFIKAEADKQPGSKQPRLHYRVWALNFPGELGRVLTFINHIPGGEYYLVLDRISIFEGQPHPRYQVLLRVYYFDRSPSPDAPAEICRYIGLDIDPDSEILLDRVYDHGWHPFQQSELPRGWGSQIFVNPGAPSSRR